MMLYNNSYTYKAASSCLIHTVATNWGWKWMPIALAINKLDSNRKIISFTLIGIGGDQYRFAANSIHARFSPRYATIWPFLRPSNNNLHGGDTHLQLSASPLVRGSAIDPIGTSSDANVQRWWKGVREPVGAYYFLFSVEFNSHPNTIPLQRLLISGTIPPLHFLRIRVPARSCNKQAGSFDPPCCKNFVLIAEPVVRDKGSSLHISCHMVAAKLFA